MVQPSTKCTGCGRYSNNPIWCPYCYAEKGATYESKHFRLSKDDYVQVPYVEQTNNIDCSEAVANMIHLWKGEDDKVLQLGKEQFGFNDLQKEIDGQMVTGTKDDVQRLAAKWDVPVPIRLDGQYYGHTVLVIGVVCTSHCVWVVHDPDKGPARIMEPDNINFNGKYIDLRPEEERTPLWG